MDAEPLYGNTKDRRSTVSIMEIKMRTCESRRHKASFQERRCMFNWLVLTKAFGTWFSGSFLGHRIIFDFIDKSSIRSFPRGSFSTRLSQLSHAAHL